MDYTSQVFIFLDVIITSILTSLVGIEREKEDKPAGIRTNIIVGGASCLLVSLVKPLIDFLNEHGSSIVNADPIRVINALIVGVSFVGAGTILKQSQQQRVTGLTTAATLLYSAGVGISIALKQYLLAVCITILVVVINHYLPKLFERFYRDRKNGN
jgi:putative Mg2+ transporter-C (MgtC) family protein